MQRLKGQRVYLAGAMDRALDRGIGWRNEITPFLENLGVTVFNPLSKPTEIGMEDVENDAFEYWNVFRKMKYAKGLLFSRSVSASFLLFVRDRRTRLDAIMGVTISLDSSSSRFAESGEDKGEEAEEERLSSLE